MLPYPVVAILPMKRIFIPKQEFVATCRLHFSSDGEFVWRENVREEQHSLFAVIGALHHGLDIVVRLTPHTY